MENIVNAVHTDEFEKAYREMVKQASERHIVKSEHPDTHEEAKDYTLTIVKELHLPNGYIFKDENGNVIQATKIVLEKKKHNISLTQEQINIMVHESCVLFCKHCGCGIPRDTCTSLGTCDEHDEYKKHIRLYLMEKECKPAKSLAERVIDYKEFVSLVKKMREAQVKRFEFYDGWWADRAIELEKEVDEYLKKMEEHGRD